MKCDLQWVIRKHRRKGFENLTLIDTRRKAGNVIQRLPIPKISHEPFCIMDFMRQMNEYQHFYVEAHRHMSKLAQEVALLRAEIKHLREKQITQSTK